jgi:ABC-type transport system involved in multi-copper enzyme maturation permease subunit
MVGLALFMELLLLLSAGFVHDARWAVGGSQRLAFAFGFAVALPAFYALGCGATAFAAEHETGTFEFRRMLPITAGRLFWSKVLFAAASTLAMIVVLWPVAVAFSGGRLPSTGQAVGLWALWGFAAVELLAWGTLFSLLSTQPLKSAILAVTTASVVVHFTTAHYIQSPSDYFYLEPYRDALPPRMAIALLVGLVDVWLGARWFREKTSASRERPISRKR